MSFRDIRAKELECGRLRLSQHPSRQETSAPLTTIEPVLGRLPRKGEKSALPLPSHRLRRRLKARGNEEEDCHSEIGILPGMSEPSGQREAPISFRPAIGRAALVALAETHGLSVNAFLNALVSRKPVSNGGALDPKTATKLMTSASRIMDWTREGNPPTDPYAVLLLEDIRQELEEIRSCLLLMLGREP